MPEYGAVSTKVLSCAAIVLSLGLGACGKDAPPTPEPTPSAAPSASANTVAAEATPGVVHGAKVEEKMILSPVYEVDEIYPSMTGPNSTENVTLGSVDEPELLWVVGFEATMVEPDGKTAASQEFMCHTNLDVDPTKHGSRFGAKKPITGRLFTLSQGQYRIDMPVGFGIPIQSDEAIMVNTQVLNLNMKEGKKKVRHRVLMRFVRDADLKKPLQPLYVAGAYGLKLLEGSDGHYGLETKNAAHEGHHEGHGQHHGHGDGEMDHTACLPGKNAGSNAFEDGKGRVFTGHWVVEPGREENHTRVTELMDLPFDTKLHYVAVHLHPFAESLELKDLTTGKTVYKAKTRQADEGIGLAHVDFFSSPEGIPLFKDHEYEMISVYNNTSGKPQDSMAVMNLYLLDKEFKRPETVTPKAAGSTEPAPKKNAPSM